MLQTKHWVCYCFTPKLKPQILDLFEMNKMFPPTWNSNDKQRIGVHYCSLILIYWLESHQLFPYLFNTSCSLIKERHAWEICVQLQEKDKREIVFLSICHVDETPGQCCVILHPQALKRKKRTLEKPALARVCSKKAHRYYLLLFPSACTLPSRPLCNKPCVSEQARFHSSPVQYFISLKEKNM